MRECLRRELREELGAEVGEVGPVLFIYRGKSVRGWMILRVAVLVKLKNYDFKFGDMTDAKFVTKDEFLTTDFAADEGTVKEFAESIWPTR
jgi:8-oxo-dGTP pyrophosphatase MutT (NUDIX family)